MRVAVKILRSACECGIDATARSIPALPDELRGALRFEVAEDCGEVHWHGGEVHGEVIAFTLQLLCNLRQVRCNNIASTLPT